MQTVVELRPGLAYAIPPALAVQEQARETALTDLARLRKEAMAEIDRLIAFLDASDTYVMNELEPDGTEDEDSDPGEDGADDEPSLGSSGHDSGGAICYLHHAISDGIDMVYDCEGDEHDGREPEDEQ